jgi:ferredoxin like protein
MSRVKVEDKLAVNKYDVDKEPHIKVSADECARCDARPCIFVCPADCFKLTSEKVTFSYEGCLECGSCRLVCDRDAVEWAYPRPGFGICYEYG